MMKEFIQYMLDFYGNNGVYPYGFTEEEIVEGTELRNQKFPGVSFCGDSVDREWVRDCIFVLRGETTIEHNYILN